MIDRLAITGQGQIITDRLIAITGQGKVTTDRLIAITRPWLMSLAEQCLRHTSTGLLCSSIHLSTLISIHEPICQPWFPYMDQFVNLDFHAWTHLSTLISIHEPICQPWFPCMEPSVNPDFDTWTNLSTLIFIHELIFYSWFQYNYPYLNSSSHTWNPNPSEYHIKLNA